MDDKLKKVSDSIFNRYENTLRALAEDEPMIFDQTEPLVDSKHTMPKNNQTYWNYRVIRKKIRGGFTFCIHEVYYENDIPVSTTTDSVAIYSESLDDIEKTLKLYLKATKEPVLNYEDIAKFGSPK